MALRIQQPEAVGKESFGPFRTYLLTRGLLLNFDQSGAVVTGGTKQSMSFPTTHQADEFGLYPSRVYAEMLDQVQSAVGVSLVGFLGSPTEEVAFRIGDHAVSASMVGEALLSRLNALESAIRARITNQTGIQEADLTVGLNVSSALEDDISYGKLGPTSLQKAIDGYITVGIPITEAFFVNNAISIAEDMRHALLAACHHFGDSNMGIQNINRSAPLIPDPNEPDDEPWENRLISGEVDEISYSFTSSVVSCYTALNLLYAYFEYLIKDPFLNPEFPSNLHFPDHHDHLFFQTPFPVLPGDKPASDLPYAIANLTAGQFGALRLSRNALVHNMAPDSLRPKAYKGWKQPPVNHQPLQYVQYLSRDIDAGGTPVTHSWVRRFYENQKDAQDSLMEWLELTWQCAFDTVEWLTTRWSNHVQNHT